MSDLRKLPLIDPRELSELGVIQEVNRLMLHPIGMALSYVEETEEEMITRIKIFFDQVDHAATPIETAMGLLELFGIRPGARIKGVLDGRDDPEGFCFAGFDLSDAATKFRMLMAERAPARYEALAYVVQPLNDKRSVGGAR